MILSYQIRLHTSFHLHLMGNMALIDKFGGGEWSKKLCGHGSLVVLIKSSTMSVVCGTIVAFLRSLFLSRSPPFFCDSPLFYFLV